MKKTNLLLTLIMLVSTITSLRAAERTAPTLPTPVKFESGKSYYLYNVGAGNFLSLDNESKPNIDTYGVAVTPEVREDGSYTLKISDQYIGAQSASTYTGSTIYDNNFFFTITTTTDGYSIQRAPSNTSYYNADEYLGFVEGTAKNRITPNLTEGNIVWQFMDVEKVERYFAKHKLYTALETSNATGCDVSYYETIYGNAESSNDEITSAANRLTNSMELTLEYRLPEWNDYPILLENDENKSWSVHYNQLRLYSVITEQNPIKLTAKIIVDEPSTLVYRVGLSDCIDCSVYINEEKVRTIYKDMLSSNTRFFEELPVGAYTIEFAYTNADGDNEFHHEYLYEIGVEKTPTIYVSLIEPGSLGTEVLYNVNHIKDVRRLKIKGKMNNDDWAKIDMMTSLFSLDLSEAQITEIPEGKFSTSNNKCQFLHEVSLPECLETIEKNAFYNSFVEKIEFPTLLKTIGESAFNSSMISTAILPDDMTNIGRQAFYSCKNLTTVSYPKKLTYIPDNCFQECTKLNTFPLHEGLKEIGYSVFCDIYNFNPRLPKSLEIIKDNAFMRCGTDSVIFPEKTSIGSNVFSWNSHLQYVEFPTTFYQIESGETPIRGATSIKTVVFKSPTVLGGKKEGFLKDCNADVTIKVPSFLVNSYKLDEYWYNYNIEGFSTVDIKEWNISGKVVLNERERMEGTPNINLQGSGSMKINGTTAMDIDSLLVFANGDGATSTAKFLSNCENISIKGQLKNSYNVTGKKWYFISMPFDFKVGDVTATASNAKFVLRYYDGASRAANGASGNWKNYGTDDIIKAGTGFIIQASVDTRFIFTALENDSKQFMVSNKEFVKALEANPSETASDKGWNLVGNPWQTYYNIHILNFTAPVTIYNVSKKTYTAYSIIDDDIAIEPNQAFFVQCPEDVSYISFPETGRQLTSEIEKQQDAVTTLAKNNRQLIDLAISCGEMSDKTRIVFNDKSSSDYETHCDASKFFSLETGVPQLYTIGEDGIQYAINERPTLDGSVKLGFLTDQKGQFTISAQRNDGMSIELTDLESGIAHDLTTSDYIFSAGAGNHNGRFILSLGKGNGTSDVESAFSQAKSIKVVENGVEISGIKGNIEVFAIDGRCIASTTTDDNTVTITTGKGVFIVKTAEKTAKVIVK